MLQARLHRCLRASVLRGEDGTLQCLPVAAERMAIAFAASARRGGRSTAKLLEDFAIPGTPVNAAHFDFVRAWLVARRISVDQIDWNALVTSLFSEADASAGRPSISSAADVPQPSPETGGVRRVFNVIGEDGPGDERPRLAIPASSSELSFEDIWMPAETGDADSSQLESGARGRADVSVFDPLAQLVEVEGAADNDAQIVSAPPCDDQHIVLPGGTSGDGAIVALRAEKKMSWRRKTLD